MSKRTVPICTNHFSAYCSTWSNLRGQCHVPSPRMPQRLPSTGVFCHSSSPETKIQNKSYATSTKSYVLSGVQEKWHSHCLRRVGSMFTGKVTRLTCSIKSKLPVPSPFQAPFNMNAIGVTRGVTVFILYAQSAVFESLHQRFFDLETRLLIVPVNPINPR